jgi:hypothetical protein
LRLLKSEGHGTSVAFCQAATSRYFIQKVLANAWLGLQAGPLQSGVFAQTLRHRNHMKAIGKGRYFPALLSSSEERAETDVWQRRWLLPGVRIGKVLSGAEQISVCVLGRRASGPFSRSRVNPAQSFMRNVNDNRQYWTT